MAETVELLNGWSEAWVKLAWAVTWQAAVLVGLAALVAVFLRRSSPVLRYWLWQIVAIKVLLMPFWTLAVPLPFLTPSGEPSEAAVAERAEFPSLPGDRPRGIVEADAAELPRAVAAVSPPSRWAALRQISWQSWLMAGWLIVVATQFAYLGWQRVRLRRLLQEASPAPESLRAVVASLAGQLGLRRVPRAVVSGADCSFFVCGMMRSVLVLPEGLLASLDEGRLRQVLLHELAHVKRLDLVFGWPVEIARRLYFFHPLVHWLAYRIRLERELACDQVAMAVSGRGPNDYIETLVHVVTQASAPPALKAAAISAGFDGNADAIEHERDSIGQGGTP